MKKMKLAVLGLVGVLAAGNALAANSATLTVSATVDEVCTFAVGPYTMPFGTIDPTDGGTDPGAATLTYTCTNGTTFTLDDVSGEHTFATGPGTLKYNIAAYTLTTVGTGAAQTLNLIGSISSIQKATAAAGSYSDTLTININP